MAERLIYCASFGFCFLIAFVIVKINKTQILELKYASLSNFYTINKKAIFVLVSIAMLYSVKTVSRNKDWKDNYTLFSNDVENMANNAKAHIFLGNEILKTIVPSQTDQAGFVNQNLFAIDELKKGLSIYPKSIDACNAIGAAYLSIDSIQQAEFYYQKGFDLDKSNPNSIADFYFKKGDFEKAIDFYELILNKNPSDLNALTNGGIAYGAIKKYDKTITNLTLASSIDNTNPIIYWYLSAAYKFKGDSLNSEKFFLKAYELDPQTARP
jgi:pentatricopeptide repeat protein